jgi:hypothetical protein
MVVVLRCEVLGGLEQRLVLTSLEATSARAASDDNLFLTEALHLWRRPSPLGVVTLEGPVELPTAGPSSLLEWKSDGMGPQSWLITCPIFETLFGGARGRGKSDGVLGEWASHADTYGENAIGLFVRRERTLLVELIERSKVLHLPLGAKFGEQDKLWRFPNGARFRFESKQGILTLRRLRLWRVRVCARRASTRH